MRKALLLVLIIVLLVPIAAWAVYKPVRVLAPEWVGGLSCKGPSVCMEDPSRYPEAAALYEAGLRFVSEAIGGFQENPRIIFCSTETCFQSFGFNQASAATVGRSGIVISPRGWKAYYVRHEMIHHRQAEELGMFATWLYPEWFIEGMAYALSADPRKALAEPWQGDRDRFLSWRQKVDKKQMWVEASKL